MIEISDNLRLGIVENFGMKYAQNQDVRDCR